MKKALILTALLACSGAAFAGFSDGNTAPVGGGLNGQQGGVHTVASLKNVPDDSYVTLEGYIVRQTRREHYIFRDSTGSIEVEIDNDVWRGVNVTPRDKVRLYAEIDQKWNGVEVDVKSVMKLQ